MKTRPDVLWTVIAFSLFAWCANAQTDYVKRINCGDSGSTTYNGETFDADDGSGYTFTGDNFSVAGHANFSLKTSPGQIFAMTRYTKLTSMQYSFPVLDGDYTVILHWAEPFHGPGLSGNPSDHRQFDVSINSGTVEDNLCVYCDAGLNQAMSRSYNVAASGGSGITIDFSEGLVGVDRKNDPIINAIEILGQAPPAVPVTSISLSPASLNLDGGQTGTLTATVLPANATDPALSWSTSDASVATVSNGTVSAVGAGTTTVQASSTDGSNITAQATVTVTAGGGTTGGHWAKTGDDLHYQSGAGNVGIGRTAITGYKLAVEGKVRSREVRVDNDTWADYVFEGSYDLPTLEEVEAHIRQKGHLMNIPSAQEVRENGLELGQMDRLLLEKIEELTLHIIRMDKEIQRLRAQKGNVQDGPEGR